MKNVKKRCSDEAYTAMMHMRKEVLFVQPLSFLQFVIVTASLMVLEGSTNIECNKVGTFPPFASWL